MVSKNMVKNFKYLLIPVFLGLVYLYQTQDSLVFSPKKMNFPDRATYNDYEIGIFRDNQVLHGWFINNLSEQNKKLLVIYGDGDQELSSLFPVADKFGDLSVLMVNYRGYGESTGEPTQNNLIGDSLDILDQICADHKIDYQDVIVYGHGLGSGVATVIAHYRNVNSLILSSPFDSMTSVIDSNGLYLPVKFFLTNHFSSISLAPLMELPTFIAIADTDDRYLAKHAQKLLSRWKGEVVEKSFPNNRYTILQDKKYWKDIKGFIYTQPKKTTAKPIEKQEFQKPIQIIYASDLEDQK
ncbi:MAG: hypothetical protein D6B28_09190 [Gammaproteobacteria bacterium]|nr:MAG: hypothetical protein D6B28_09190 [Gammaproteobacteria bacterium]